MLFHRAAATLYLIYAAWGLASTFLGIPSINQVQGQIWQISFSLMVLICCVPACIGATFFPRTGRLEMYAASAFVGLLILYIGILVFVGFHDQDYGKLASALLITSIIVTPLSRMIFVYVTLIRIAKLGEQNAT